MFLAKEGLSPGRGEKKEKSNGIQIGKERVQWGRRLAVVRRGKGSTTRISYGLEGAKKERTT